MEKFDLQQNSQIDFAIAIKTNQLRREYLESLTAKQVRDTLFGFIWSLHTPKTLSEAVDDILKLNVNEVVAFLSNQAVVLGAQMSLDEFSDLFESSGIQK